MIKDYKENDNEVLFMISEGNENATEYIVNKYKNIIDILISKYMLDITRLGLEEKDLYQEGMIGLLSAIDSYKETKDATFKTFASRCIENKINTALTKANNTKNKNLNDSVSLDYVNPDTNTTLYDVIGSNDLIDDLITKENYDEIISLAENRLKGFEKEVFDLKIKEYSNEEISNILNEDKRKIENALFRIRTKLKKN